MQSNYARPDNNALNENIPNASRNLWSSDKERHADVKFIRHSFAFDESILTKVIAMIRCVDNIGVVQLSEIFQFTTDLQKDTALHRYFELTQAQ